LLLPAACLSLIANEEYTFNLQAIDAWFLFGLSIKSRFYLGISVSSVSEKHLKGGACSIFLGLPPSIFHRILSNALFVLFVFLFPLLLSGANLAFRQRAEEVQAIKVRFLLAFTTRVVL